MDGDGSCGGPSPMFLCDFDFDFVWRSLYSGSWLVEI